MALNKGYSLLSAVELNKMHPDTFEIPSAEDRHNLRAGDLAKLIFKPRVKGGGIIERMWVRVFKKMNGEGVYEGALDNDPAFEMKSLIQYEDVVMFRPEHVADIMRK